MTDLFELRRRDGPSVGPVSTRHVVGIFAYNGVLHRRTNGSTSLEHQRLDLGHAPGLLKEETAQTQLRLCRPDGHGATTSVLCYGDAVRICSRDASMIKLTMRLDEGRRRDAEKWGNRFRIESVQTA